MLEPESLRGVGLPVGTTAAPCALCVGVCACVCVSVCVRACWPSLETTSGGRMEVFALLEPESLRGVGLPVGTTAAPCALCVWVCGWWACACACVRVCVGV